MNATKSPAPTQARQVTRTVRLVQPLDHNGRNGAVLITVARGKKAAATEYDLERVPSDWGECYALTPCRYDPEGDKVYHVCLDRQGHSCECQGFLRWDHCKHVEGVLALKAAGKL